LKDHIPEPFQPYKKVNIFGKARRKVKMDSLLNSIISNCANIDEKLGTSFVSLIRNISCELDEHALT
jgi:hypothetical protein